jgi:hypothetical protein
MDTWRITPKITLDAGLRMYKWGHPYNGGGEASAFSFERFDASWGGKPPVLYEPVLVGSARRARNPVTGEILPDTFIGLIVPGTGYSCGVITPDRPCDINGVVIQDDPTYREGDRGFVEPIPVQFDPRHDGTGGDTFEGGPAYRFSRVTRFTDLNTYLGGTSAVSPVGASGTVRVGAKRPSIHKYTVGIQREIGWNVVADVAYVGEFVRYLGDDFNHNAIPAGARFDPANRDPTLTPSPSNPRALPDVFLRPIRGFGDLNISEPVNTARYDSLQVQVTRRFTGRFELSGSYTMARGYTNDRFQGNPLTGTYRDYNNNLQDHVVVVGYQVDLPNGGRMLGDSAVARGILDGWRVSGISTFATGPWSDVSFSYSPSFEFTGGGEACDGSGSQPFHVVGDPNKNAPGTEERWFDTSVFQPASGRGDIGNDAACLNHKIQLPGFHNHDVSFFKDFDLPGDQRITFKWEIANLFDQVSWQSVDTSGQFNPNTGQQTDANFGRVTAARNERRMVFSFRYTF